MTAPETPHSPERPPPIWMQTARPAEGASARAKLIGRYREGGVSNVAEHARDYLRFHSCRIRLAATARLLDRLALNRSFQLENKRYRYLFHPHTTTWRNERCVEIPLAAEVLNAWSGKRILEIGNVLGHFMPITHDVLDKYEHADGVINEDVIEFTPTAPYDLILSISTLEHVGWDETELEPEKARTAINRLTEILAPGGRVWLTVPRGYHRYLDRDVDRRHAPVHPPHIPEKNLAPRLAPSAPPRRQRDPLRGWVRRRDRNHDRDHRQTTPTRREPRRCATQIGEPSLKARERATGSFGRARDSLAATNTRPSNPAQCTTPSTP